MMIDYSLLKYRGLQPDPKRHLLYVLALHAELLKDDRKGKLDPFLIKVPGKLKENAFALS